MTNIRKAIIERIATELENLDDRALLEQYELVRGAKPPSVPPPAPAEPRDVSTRPGSTLAIVWRVLSAAGRPLALRDIVDLAHRENRALTRAMVSGALSRLVGAGRAIRTGPARSGEYRLTLPPKRE